MEGISRRAVASLWLFHIFIIAISNFLVQMQFTFAGLPFNWGMFTFPLIVLATDLTVRLLGNRTARVAVGLAYVPAIAITLLLAPWRIAVASGTAYLVGQLLDIFVFRRVRERFGAWWVAPAIATLFSNLVDTYTFYSVAFHGSSDIPEMAENWLSYANVDFALKTIVSVLIILPIYGFVLNYAVRRMAESPSRS